MKKFLLLATMLAVLLPLNAKSANLEDTKILDRVQHGKWDSFVLANGKDVSPRMITHEVGGSTALAVDTYPKTCGAFLMQINICQNNLAGEELNETTTGSVRIDERSIFDVEYAVKVDNSCMMITLLSRSSPTIFKDLMAGNFVRFKINPMPSSSATTPIFKRYSLSGFTAARKRVLSLCQAIEEVLNKRSDSDYFNEQRKPTPKAYPPVQKQPEKKDSDFFI